MNTRPLITLSILILSFWLNSTPCLADWVSLTGAENAPNIAEIHIYKDHVKVELEIFVNDIITFDRLIPDEYLQGINVKRPSHDVRMRRFSSEDLQMLADGSQRLIATLKRIEPRLRKERPSPYAGKINPYTGQIIPGPPEDKRVIYVELTYPFTQRPRSLTIIPPLDENGISKVPIGFITYHEGVQVIDFRFLGQPVHLKLDWDDPWYSEFEEKNLKRWQRGSVMSFLYVEPLEVRHEVLARVKDLEAWLDLGLRGDQFIEPDENEPLKERIGEFFLKQEAVTIDGKRLQPILDRTAFVKYTVMGSTFLEQPERIPINTAMIGVIITYLTDEIPREVRVQWDLWSDRIQQVPTDTIDPAGPFPSFVTPDDNVQVWNNYLKTYQPPTVVRIDLDESLTTMKVPLASALCFLALIPLVWLITKRKGRAEPFALHLALAVVLVVAALFLRPFLHVSVARPTAIAPSLTEEQATAVLDSLLRNTYRSFEFRGEEAVYDKLATSVSGDLLADIYLMNRRSLAVTQAGGAQARVTDIEIEEVKVETLSDPPLAMLYRARWTAEGSVNHWGHIHTRKNLYEAHITVEPVDGAWKIMALQILDEQRIDPYALQPASPPSA